MPVLTDNPVENSFYEGWIYAAVANTTGTGLAGLYVSKDFGGDWVSAQLPEFVNTSGTFGTNNTSLGDINTLLGNPITGLVNLTLAVDPNDPEIVYLGGGGSNLLQIDLSNLSDPYALVGYNDIAPRSRPDAVSNTRRQRPGVDNQHGVRHARHPAEFQPALPLEQGPAGSTNYYNLYRDPQNPFLHPSTLQLARSRISTPRGPASCGARSATSPTAPASASCPTRSTCSPSWPSATR